MPWFLDPNAVRTVLPRSLLQPSAALAVVAPAMDIRPDNSATAETAVAVFFLFTRILRSPSWPWGLCGR
jgi:hypothetical protein